jgi:hypothetical protein
MPLLVDVLESLLPFLSRPSQAMLWHTNNVDIQTGLRCAGMLPPAGIPTDIPAKTLNDLMLMPSNGPYNNRLSLPSEVVQSVDCLKWAIMSGDNYEGKLWSFELCVEIVRNGTLEVLQWVRAQTPPCPWGLSVVSAALYHSDDSDGYQLFLRSKRNMLNYMHDSEMKRLGMNSMVGVYLEKESHHYDDEGVRHYVSWLVNCTQVDVARQEVQRAAKNGWIPVLHHYWKIDQSYFGEAELEIAAHNRRVDIIIWSWGPDIGWDMYNVIDIVDCLATKDQSAGGAHMHTFDYVIDALNREKRRVEEEDEDFSQHTQNKTK